MRRKTDICPFPEHPRSPYTGLRAVPLLTEGLAVVEGLGVVSQGGPAADGAGLVLRSKWDQMRPFSMREPPRTRRPGNVTSEMDEASSDKTSPCGRAMRRTRARFRPHRAPPRTAPTLSFRIMRRRQKGKRGEDLRGQLIEQLAARGYELNIYNVPNMKAFWRQCSYTAVHYCRFQLPPVALFRQRIRPRWAVPRVPRQGAGSEPTPRVYAPRRGRTYPVARSPSG